MFRPTIVTMVKRIFLISILALLSLLIALVFKPVPIVSEDRLLSVKGTVDTIYEGGTNDVVFIINNHPVKYYINRGLESGLILEKLQRDLIGQNILLKYPKYWTPLDPKDRIKHVSKVYFEKDVIFSEVD